MQTTNTKKTDTWKFASMNSSIGFVSYFQNYFDSLDKLYILKGGPGTGKSHLMKTVYYKALQKGYTAVAFRCSSDPDSLDGIIINELSLGIIDGTAPHTRDPKYPGAVDKIINLGQFWDENILLENKNSIKFLCHEKSLCYDRAISMLGMYDKAMSECEKIILPLFDREKAVKMFLRLFKNAEKEISPRNTQFVFSSPGMKGMKAAVFDESLKILNITPFYSLEYLVLSTGVRVLEKLGIPHSLSMSPIRHERPNAVLVPSLNLLITNEDIERKKSCDVDIDCNDDTPNSKTGKINSKRFLISEKLPLLRKDLKSTKKAAEPFLDLALESFEKMKGIHFGLEDIYLSSMDLRAKEKFTNEFLKTIF